MFLPILERQEFEVLEMNYATVKRPIHFAETSMKSMTTAVQTETYTLLE